MKTRLTLVFLLFGACGDDSVSDGGVADVSLLDAVPPDAPLADAGQDAQITDAGNDAPMDVGIVDAGNDVPTDVGSDVPPCTECGGECTDVMTSVEHCGVCDSPCAGENADGTCVMGMCELVCRDGFADCDDDPSNGCESDLGDTASCGSCENVCAAGPGGVPSCEGGVCGIVCDVGLDRCSELPFEEGCPVVLASSLEHCGGCDQACAPGTGVSAALCEEAMCSNICPSGSADCDGILSNGCEVDTASDMNCGACGNTCDAVSYCNGGVCERRAVVFVTSTTTPGRLFGGIAGADAICAARAAAAGLPGIFWAWLSDTTTSPATRFARSANGYVRVDGEVVASSWADLTDGSLRVPIIHDEFGMPVVSNLNTGFSTCDRSQVATGTQRDGNATVAFNCNDWNGVSTGSAGETVATTRWSAGCGGPYICTDPMRLYCFQQAIDD